MFAGGGGTEERRKDEDEEREVCTKEEDRKLKTEEGGEKCKMRFLPQGVIVNEMSQHARRPSFEVRYLSNLVVIVPLVFFQLRGS